MNVILIVGLIMVDVGVNHDRCIELISSDIIENNRTVKYPSSLGRNCDSKTKQGLVLYLVRQKMY